MAPGRYGSIDSDGGDFAAVSELQLAGLAEVALVLRLYLVKWSLVC